VAYEEAVEQEETVALRRTWPQRFVILGALGLIAASIGAAYFVQDFYSEVADIGRIEFSGDLLDTETPPGEPVNFLIIGLDSAEGLDPDDPATFFREVDPRGTHNADSISILRVDPIGGQAWALTIPRDLQVEIPGRGERKINSASLVEGPQLLVETIIENFDIPINHYVELDFLAFRDVVDELDGVTMWFPYTSRDLETGFNAFEPGCTTLDGANALGFVRSRNYEQLIDGAWVRDTTADFGRIERQQQFVISALDRAIARGARNPTTLASLIDSAAESVTLDQGLTPAELIDLAEAFTDFDSESLQTFSPAVVDIRDEDGNWEALGLDEPLDAPMFQIFRGVADGLSRSEVRFVVAGADEGAVVEGTEQLRELGFSVGPERIVAEVGADNVIIHPSGARAEAELLARYILPTPALIEDQSTTEMAVVFGTNYDGISFLFPQPVEDTLAAIDDFGDVAMPSLSTITSTSTSTTTSVSPIDADDPATTITTTSTSTTTTVAPATTTTTTAAPLPGRPPEGETCG
jgi:LCP family protein required for cell wall assembly